MRISTRPRKIIAATFLVTLLTNLLAPTVTYALTNGPNSPEASSFEPVDTTNMVNEQTGDLTYNIPLFEVPGPEGGYPLSLAYHAGILPDADASWVGLGWSLNPGAINRNVNGIPDDWQNLQNSSRTYWAGGHVSTFGISASIGSKTSPVNVNFGLSIAKDTYKGFGVGWSMGLSQNNRDAAGNPDGKLNASIGVGMDPFGKGPYLSGGFSSASSIEGTGLSISSGVNFKADFSGVNAGYGAGMGFAGLLGVSMNSSGSKPSMAVGGISSYARSTKDAGIQTSSHGLTIPIPLYKVGSVTLSYNKTRYWSDEKSSYYNYGSIFHHGYAVGGDGGAFDTYSELEDPATKDIVAYPDPTVLQGGSYPDFDVYDVSAQGLSGNIRPYKFEDELMQQNHKDASNNPIVTYYIPNWSSSGVNGNAQFKFVNDFSNRYTQSYPVYSGSAVDLSVTTPPFDLSPVYGNNDANTGADMTSGLGAIKLEGSRHIDVGVKIKPSIASGYLKTDRYKTDMIDGFSITNESGVTYHYGLPAYSFGEENYQEKIDTSGGLSFNRQQKLNAYAYTWYLTTITGPDFVDRNNDSQAGDGDWGYYINFNYGKWSNNYVWRNPSEGFHRDEDNKWQGASIGYREVYYLNSITSRTHAAVFEKDLRYDAKGSSPAVFDKNTDANTGAPTKYSNNGIFDINSSQSLQLSKIYLLNISDFNFVGPSSGNSASYSPSGRTIACSDCELPSNIIDKNDVNSAGRFALESKALRIIDFSYDYSLCPYTVNSFDANNSAIKYGKLTLNSVAFRGKSGANLIPPIKFNYELLDSEKKTQAGVTLTQNSFSTTNSSFQKGDLIAQSTASNGFCGVITSISVANGVYTYSLKNGNYTGGTISTTVYTTKNPPYNKNCYDMWNMYKSDCDMSITAQNENMGRNTNAISSKSVDVWSLRSVTTSLGDLIRLNYESDTYNQAVLGNDPSTVIKNIISTNRHTITFNIEDYNTGLDISTVVTVGKVIPRILLCVPYGGPAGCTVNVTQENLGTLTITGISGSDITGELANPIPDNYLGQAIWIGQIATGNIWLNNGSDSYGGGIRVSSVNLDNAFSGKSTSTNYNYDNAGRSSGVTSYCPIILDAFNVQAVQGGAGTCTFVPDYSIYYYTKSLYQYTNSLYAIARELPPPGVMYEYVTVTRKIKNPDEAETRLNDGSTQYHFEVFRNNMVGREEVSTPQQWDNQGPQNTRYWAMRKFVSSIGNVKSITQYDKTGRKLSEVVNHYLHDGLENLSFHDFMAAYKLRLAQYNNQGFFQERYAEIKKVKNPYYQTTPGFTLLNPENLGGTKATLSEKEEYPCVNIGQTQINYINGTQANGENLAYDFYSGALTKSVETDSYGNRVMTELTPAYKIYAAMGLKISDANNKNMLTQTAGTYIWKVDGSNNKLAVISANAKTWSDLVQVYGIDGSTYTQNVNATPVTYGDVWRPQFTYNWMPATQTSDGLTSAANFSDFNFSAPASSNASWKKTGEITAYDVYSKAVEAKDMNGISAATKLDYGNKRVVLSGNNANYYELAYSGAEDDGITQTNNLFVHAADGIVSSAANTAHTGSKSLKIGVSGKKGLVYSVPLNKLTSSRDYIANVWVKPTTGTASNVKLFYDVDGVVKNNSISSGSSTKIAGGWSLLNLIIKGTDLASGTTLNVGCRNDDGSIEAYVDDMRFQPLNSQTNAYVYDAFSGELTYILDNNNLYTRFAYDGAGRLVNNYKEKLGIGEFKTNSIQYNYSAAKYASAAINAGYTKECAVGYSGSIVNVTVPAGMFTSFVSQSDANALSQQYAQDYANSHGVCTQLVAVTCNNTVHVSGFTATYTNTTTGSPYTFSVPTGGGVIGYLPDGNYNISITKTGNTTSYTFNSGCGTSNYITGTSASYSSQPITLNSGCNSILISNPL